MIAQRIDYAKHYSRSHDAVIRVYDEAGAVIATARARRRVQGVVSDPVWDSSRTKSRHDAADDEQFSPAVVSDPPN